jgi:Cytochrome P460
MRSCLFLLLLTALAAADGLSDGPQFTAEGQLVRPADYREWIFLSSGLGMTYGPPEAAAAREPRFDNVFVNRSAYQSFLKTGMWPDKTMFVLEVRTSESAASINKGGRFQTGAIAMEAEVKSAGKWTFYGFGKDGANGKPIPATANCYSCHSQHGAVDNTFVQFYPTLLNVAREKGTVKP